MLILLAAIAPIASPSPAATSSAWGVVYLVQSEPVLTTGVFLAAVAVVASILAMRWVSVPKAGEEEDGFSFSSPRGASRRSSSPPASRVCYDVVAFVR